MNLRHLHAFATIVDVGGLAKAATRLHLSQPALSRQIQTLEADLGVALFDRIGRRVQLTSQGEDLLLRSRRLLAEAESLGERARELKSGETGILRVAATPQVIENLLARFSDPLSASPSRRGGAPRRGWRRAPAGPARTRRGSSQHYAGGHDAF